MEWWAFFLALFNRTGGAGAPIDILTLQKQDEISQDVPPQNAATMAALQGVNDLWAEQRAPENLSQVRARLADLESQMDGVPNLGAVYQKLNDLESMMADYRLPSPVVLEQWNAPSLLNSWTYYGAPFNTPGYWKDPNGIVHLRGVLKPGTYGASMFQLPAGYRPAAQELIGVDTFAAADTMGRIEIQTDGNVIARNGGATFLTIDSVTFRAA